MERCDHLPILKKSTEVIFIKIYDAYEILTFYCTLSQKNLILNVTYYNLQRRLSVLGMGAASFTAFRKFEI